jgi:hypothetical protein
VWRSVAVCREVKQRYDSKEWKCRMCCVALHGLVLYSPCVSS